MKLQNTSVLVKKNTFNTFYIVVCHTVYSGPCILRPPIQPEKSEILHVNCRSGLLHWQYVFHGSSGLHVLTSTAFRVRLQTTLQKIGLSARDYGTHSLRRGGATWLFLSGVPVPTIKLLGDWKSDCVEQYLRPDVSDRLKVVAAASSTL